MAAIMAALTAGGGLWIRHRRQRPAPVAVQPVVQQPVVLAPPPAEEPKPEPPKAEPAKPAAQLVKPEPPKAEPAKPAAQPVKTEPEPDRPEPRAKAGAYATLDQAARALDTDPRGALTFLDNLVKQEPGNERAIALRIAALYDAGDYRGCAIAIRESRQAGHLLWPMALKYPRLRKALEQEKLDPRLPRRKPAQ